MGRVPVILPLNQAIVRKSSGNETYEIMNQPAISNPSNISTSTSWYHWLICLSMFKLGWKVFRKLDTGYEIISQQWLTIQAWKRCETGMRTTMDKIYGDPNIPFGLRMLESPLVPELQANPMWPSPQHLYLDLPVERLWNGRRSYKRWLLSIRANGCLDEPRWRNRHWPRHQTSLLYFSISPCFLSLCFSPIRPPSASGRSCSCRRSCWLMISWILCSCRGTMAPWARALPGTVHILTPS